MSITINKATPCRTYRTPGGHPYKSTIYLQAEGESGLSYSADIILNGPDAQKVTELWEAFTRKLDDMVVLDINRTGLHV